MTVQIEGPVAQLSDEPSSNESEWWQAARLLGGGAIWWGTLQVAVVVLSLIFAIATDTGKAIEMIFGLNRFDSMLLPAHLIVILVGGVMISIGGWQLRVHSVRGLNLVMWGALILGLAPLIQTLRWIPYVGTNLSWIHLPDLLIRAAANLVSPLFLAYFAWTWRSRAGASSSPGVGADSRP